MAKGVEDTAFYRYARLLALNDVGGDPGRFGVSRRATSTPPTPSAPSASRATCWSRRRTTPSARATCGRGSARWPGCPTSGRARVRALARRRRAADARRARRRRAVLLFQTLVGAWPIAAERLRGLPGEGAARGQAHTSWIDPDEAHEAAVQALRARAARRTRPFLRRLRAVRRARSPRRASARRSGSCCSSSPSPGVPDIYQGDELRPLARRPRQPPPGRLGAPPRGAGRAARPARPPTRETRKLGLIARALDAARAPARGVRRRLRAARGGAGACAFLRGRRGARRRGPARLGRRRARGPGRPPRRLGGRAHRRPGAPRRARARGGARRRIGARAARRA